MLLDRGLLVREGNVYRPTGPIETLEVPETLHALIAARLDSLAPEERRVVQDGAVLGKTFTKLGLSNLTGLPEAELAPLLASLLRKEVLSIQADPRSPERGQYSFLQDIVKHVAYETISRKGRKAKHLAAARFLSSVWSAEEDEIVDVVAAHYLDAYEAAPGDPDAEEIRSKAREMLVRAAERAASLAANLEAQRAFERALELTDDPVVKAELHEQAGTMARIGGRADHAMSHYEASIGSFEAADATHPAARVSARLAEVLWDRGRLELGLENMDRAFEVLSKEQPDEDLASLAAQLGRFMFFAGDTDLSIQRIERALDLAEALSLPEVLSQALNTKALILISRGRKKEALALLRYALDVALEHDKPSAALRAYHNLSDSLQQMDRYEEAAEARQNGLTLARRVGNRYHERNLLGQVYSFFSLGRWDDVESVSVEILQENLSEARVAFTAFSFPAVAMHVHRGRLQEAEQILSLFSELETSADLTERTAWACAKSTIQLAQGAPEDALNTAEGALALREGVGISSEFVKESFVTAVQAAIQLGDLAKADELIAIAEALPPGRYPQFLRAQSSRLRAGLATLRGDGGETELFKGAVGLFRELAVPFYMAVTELEHGEWLVAQTRVDEADPLLAEADEIFERLGAVPWLERIAQATQGGRKPEAATAPS
ncbi:MAG: hypothetical protein M3O98_07355 [Actinomycetota bacterium]|nr:hypothetical protein [Actinomycetota bacterium]